ncbi:rCG60641 [Rattus norvegicus]|uniref:RCG60641 n=1 Tax=Rattus norvegicus TaxID=10116 RepID=A6JJS5_RAT|nr:rCG60641 [Rattus norvegicus]
MKPGSSLHLRSFGTRGALSYQMLQKVYSPKVGFPGLKSLLLPVLLPFHRSALDGQTDINAYHSPSFQEEGHNSAFVQSGASIHPDCTSCLCSSHLHVTGHILYSWGKQAVYRSENRWLVVLHERYPPAFLEVI